MRFPPLPRSPPSPPGADELPCRTEPCGASPFCLGDLQHLRPAPPSEATSQPAGKSAFTRSDLTKAKGKGREGNLELDDGDEPAGPAADGQRADERLILAGKNDSQPERPDCIRAAGREGERERERGSAKLVETGLLLGRLAIPRPRRKLRARADYQPRARARAFPRRQRFRPFRPSLPALSPLIFRLSSDTTSRFLGRFLALSMARGFSFRLARNPRMDPDLSRPTASIVRLKFNRGNIYGDRTPRVAARASGR